MALLAALVLVTKTYSDFADTHVSNAVLCDRRSGLRQGWPLCTGPRISRAEHDLLQLLEFRTTVRAASPRPWQDPALWHTAPNFAPAPCAGPGERRRALCGGAALRLGLAKVISRPREKGAFFWREYTGTVEEV